MSVLEEYLELVRAATAEIESLRQQLAESKVILQEAQALRSRLADKEILLAQAVEYGDNYKRERDYLMGNYQAALARLEEAGRVLNHICATVYNAETRSMIQAFLRAADSGDGRNE